MNRNLDTFAAAEQRVKISHFTQQGFDIQGVVHVGAHDGEECGYYLQMGIERVIAFEPLDSAIKVLRERYPAVVAKRIALGNKIIRKAQLHIAGGDGKGSSFLKVNKDHPEVQTNWNNGQAEVVGTQTVTMVKFKSWAKSKFKHPELYDCLVLDTQGNELDVLMGMGDYLQGFKYLSVELSETPVYKGEAPAQQVIDWLAEREFIQDSPICSHDDVFFVRKDMKSESDLVYRGLC